MLTIILMMMSKCPPYDVLLILALQRSYGLLFLCTHRPPPQMFVDEDGEDDVKNAQRTSSTSRAEKNRDSRRRPYLTAAGGAEGTAASTFMG